MEEQRIIYKQYVNIGIAVDTERGLVVPVVARADRLSIPEIARQLAEIAEKVRESKFTLEDSARRHVHDQQPGRDRRHLLHADHQRARGGDPAGRPLAQAAGRGSNDEIAIRLMMPLSLSYDHRLVDGATAARFLNDVIGYLEAPGRLLLAP